MSHFTHIKTSFQNFVSLKNALNRLQIPHQAQETSMENFNLVIPQSNGYEIHFDWNGQEYELVADLSFWEQPYSAETFMDHVAQQYAGEVILRESQKRGFQAIHSKQNVDGSNTLILERWGN